MSLENAPDHQISTPEAQLANKDPLQTPEERRIAREQANVGVLESSIADLEATFQGLKVSSLVSDIRKNPDDFSPDIETLYDALWNTDFDTTGMQRFNKLVETGKARALVSLLTSNYRYQRELDLLSPSNDVDEALYYHIGRLDKVRISRHNLGNKVEGILTAEDLENGNRSVYQWTIQKLEPVVRESNRRPEEKDGSFAFEEEEEINAWKAEIRKTLGIYTSQEEDVEKTDLDDENLFPKNMPDEAELEYQPPDPDEIPEDEL